MGLIWVHELDGWSVLRLDERPVRLDVSPLRVLQDREVGVGGDFPVALVFSDKDKPQWAVIAAEGTGVIAGKMIRPLLELAGIRNVLSKAYGSTTPKNLLKAGIDALQHLRTAEQIQQLRGVSIA